MQIDCVDFFYLRMPEVLDEGDGSQDALLVRVQAGGFEGWGECEASPLVSIASFVCPMSHSACKPVEASVLGQSLNDVADIERISNLVRANSFDLLQADHTLSGVEIAMWDLLGKKLEVPVWDLLGYKHSHAKRPYASALFGDTPQITLGKARETASAGYRAAKFGWGPFGKGDAKADSDQIHAAREGLGEDAILLVDAGTVWEDDVERASGVVRALEECGVLWLEEPFHTGALGAYKSLSERTTVKIAGGEGCHNAHMALQMVDYAGLGYIQIDTGRIGGILPAKRVADYAASRGVTYVNHTFTSHLALSASLQPFAGLKDHIISEYPVEPKALATELTTGHIERDAQGEIYAPYQPGLGVAPDEKAIRKYLVDAEIVVNGKKLYSTPSI